MFADLAGASDEHVAATQAVSHPVDRLPSLEEARPAVVIAASPADGPLSGAHPFDELEAVSACLVEYVVVRHLLMVARR